MPSNQLEIQLKNSKTDKELKSVFKKIASKEPDKYFPTKELMSPNIGFQIIGKKK